MSQILVINGSARPYGDTRKKIEAHLQLVNYDLINLAEHYIEPYNYEDKYSLDDEFAQLTKQFVQYETIILATPVYWYAMSGRLKTFLDRTTEWVTTNKTIGHGLKGKDISVLAVGTDPELPDGFKTPFLLTADYFKMNFKGCVYFCVE